MDDDEFSDLMEAVATRRDREAFTKLHTFFAPRILAYFLRRGVERSAAEDHVQNVMVKIWRHAHKYKREKAAVSTWIFAIVRHSLTDDFRQQRGEPPLGDDALLIPDTIEPPDEALNSAQLQEQVRTAISKLPAEQLAMIQMAFFEGLTHKQISARTGLPLGTVKGRLRSALARLRVGLDDAAAAGLARKIFKRS